MQYRGSYDFEIDDKNNIVYSANNLNLLRKLWLDREILKKEECGPGDPGDFDNGAWHIACHLVAAGGVFKAHDKKLIWLEISFDNNAHLYIPTLTIRNNQKFDTINLNSQKAKEYLENSNLLGFVEGTSEGRISAQNVIDDTKLFNGSLRQEYNQIPGSTKDGGKVWEHWCTTRDIRESSSIGTSVLNSYLKIASICGDEFISTVARGRIDYDHPKQLQAFIKTGFVSQDSTQINIAPTIIPQKENLLFQEANPQSCLIAIENLNWEDPLKYYMFERRIDRWNYNL